MKNQQKYTHGVAVLFCFPEEIDLSRYVITTIKVPVNTFNPV